MNVYQRKQTSFEMTLAIKPHFLKKKKKKKKKKKTFCTVSMRLAYALTATDIRMRENDVTLGIPKSSYIARLRYPQT